MKTATAQAGRSDPTGFLFTVVLYYKTTSGTICIKVLINSTMYVLFRQIEVIIVYMNVKYTSIIEGK